MSGPDRCRSELRLITAPSLPGLSTIIQLRDQIRSLSGVTLVAQSASHQATNPPASICVSRKSGFLDNQDGIHSKGPMHPPPHGVFCT